VLHQLGHGLTCKYFGGTVTEIGLMWRFPMLVPYCKTDDMMLFATRRARVATAFAGMFVGLLALLPLLGWWALAPAHSLSRAVAAGLVLFGGLTALSNLVPFLQLDGYQMLSNSLGVVDLRAETRRYWTKLFTSRAAEQRAELRAYRSADRWIYMIYGPASVAFYVGGYLALCFLWFRQLEHWMSPLPAGLLLGLETVLILALLGLARRPRGATAIRPSAG